MANKYHFIAGLPRSGSTLLSALLRQNQRFHAGVTSPLYAMTDRMIAAMSADKKYLNMIDDACRARVLRGLFDSFYEESAAEVIFDTNRLWTANIALIAQLFPNAKLICCVRDVFRIIDSFERIIRKNPLQYNSLFNFSNEPGIYGRVKSLMNVSEGVIGAPHSALRSAWYTEFADRLIFIRFESLTTKPTETLGRLYTLLDEPAYTHDIAGVDGDEVEYDLRIGLPGLHRLRKGVTPGDQPLTIPPDIYQTYAKSDFWNSQEENIRGIPIL